MNLLFATESFRNECNNQEQLVRKYGALRARLLRQRLDELFNAESLDEIRSLPHVALLSLPEDPSTLAVDAGYPWLLAFRPEPPPPAGKPADGDFKKVDSITILGLSKADEKSSPKPV